MTAGVVEWQSLRPGKGRWPVQVLVNHNHTANELTDSIFTYNDNVFVANKFCGSGEGNSRKVI